MKMKSSSSSLSFGSKTHSFGCISLFLQKLLCSGAISTYPSDQITEPCFGSPDFTSEPARVIGGEPGAVARLMGLESLPVADKTRVVSRSRWVNSGENVKRDDDEIQGKHRRVKSTLEYVELEDDNFFILSFEKARNDKAFGELKQLGTRKCKKRRESRDHQNEAEIQTRIEGKENINAMKVSPGREETGELKQRIKEKRKNMRKRREIQLRQNIKNYGRWSRDEDLVNREVKSMKEEEECRSCDDSSPVSVLDYDRVTPEPENTSRRRLSSQLESSRSKEPVQEDHTSRESETRVHGYQEMWHMICRLTVSELEESNSVYRKASKLGDLEGSITEDIASNILDQLLEETITTLSLTSQV
ncbi:hypothetical protein Bca4012_045240 [Brassica carinata]|uniref:DUF3741 domain-containing protein n=3 Tax=Brassica TaxID=3705 RepID=A0ABQ7XVJ3_BRANA|nr:uncharacterized protein BNAC09G33930D [Brassica napus]KAG2274738.1 hypothetical protein Bca52824_057293 [Brassica carinata]KAH0859970.1 hypothetical protein HID58_088231 [Brassica napus]VDD32598.1 unnamed protein product [Brassica oleracea]